MKKTILLAGIVVLSFLVRCAVAQEVAPDFTLTDIDGVDFSLSDFRGKVVLLDFFATWCGACVDAIPHLKSLHGEFGEDLIIVTISVDPYSDTVETLQQFREDHGIDWIVARDTVGVHEEYGMYYLPTLVIIDQEGYIQHEHSGSIDESVLREEIHEIMRAAPPTISILSPENKTYTTSSVPLTFTVNEPPFWIGYSLDGQANLTIAGNTTLTNLSDDIHTITVWANDTDGNMGCSDIAYFTVSIPITGELAVVTSPVVGEVFVDGVLWGLAPQSRMVQVGTYAISFGPVDSYLTPLDEVATVYKDQETVVEGVYEEIPLAKGALMVRTTPISGDVIVNGSSWGLAPQSRAVDVGTYNVSFGSVAGYYTPDWQLVTVKENAETVIDQGYELITGKLTITATPVAAEVFVNGTSWGIAPQSRAIQVGTYIVTFGDVEGYSTPAYQVISAQNAEYIAEGVYEPLAPFPIQLQVLATASFAIIAVILVSAIYLRARGLY
ncbi:MAG: TlpA family protein disulfide reductase [Candidatus Bathyarchaeota archaeon]|nr:MAG: TlpA family protein disulfide reductase [Candidatus Bathyarchaeota archaeon]